MSHSDEREREKERERENTDGGTAATLREGVGAPHLCPREVGSKLPLLLYTDARLHILVTHCDIRYVYDFGQEFAGVVELTLPVGTARGTIVTLKHAEVRNMPTTACLPACLLACPYSHPRRFSLLVYIYTCILGAGELKDTQAIASRPSRKLPLLLCMYSLSMLTAVPAMLMTSHHNIFQVLAHEP